MYKILHIPTSLFISNWSLNSKDFFYIETEIKDFEYALYIQDKGIFIQCIFKTYSEAEIVLDKYIKSMYQLLEDTNKKIRLGSTAEIYTNKIYFEIMEI